MICHFKKRAGKETRPKTTTKDSSYSLLLSIIAHNMYTSKGCGWNVKEADVESIYRRFRGTQVGELCKEYIKLLDENRRLKQEKKERKKDVCEKGKQARARN